MLLGINRMDGSEHSYMQRGKVSGEQRKNSQKSQNASSIKMWYMVSIMRFFQIIYAG